MDRHPQVEQGVQLPEPRGLGGEALGALPPYSPECVEGEFPELRVEGVLGSSPRRSAPDEDLLVGGP